MPALLARSLAALTIGAALIALGLILDPASALLDHITGGLTRWASSKTS